MKTYSGGHDMRAMNKAAGTVVAKFSKDKTLLILTLYGQQSVLVMHPACAYWPFVQLQHFKFYDILMYRVQAARAG